MGEARGASEATRPKRNQALRARFEARAALDEEGGIGGALAGLFGDGAEGFRGEVLAGPASQRISVDGENSFSIVLGAKKVLFWEHESRLAAELAVAELPSVEASRWRVEDIERGEREQATATLLLSDPTLGNLRQEITLSTDPELAPFGPAMVRALFSSPGSRGEPEGWLAQIGEAGLPVRQRCVNEDGQVISEMAIEVVGVERVETSEFALPRGSKRFLDQMAKPQEIELDPDDLKADEAAADEEQAGTIEQALGGEGGTRSQTAALVEDAFPDCLGSSRGGSIAASLTQDALSFAASAVNTFVPFIGATTITSSTYPGPGGASALQGRWVIPWLANMAAIPATGAGSGIFCMLRAPRRLTTSPGGAAGGQGILDRLAWRSLITPDGSGMLLTQRLFAAGTLPTELAKWGASAPASLSPLWAATSSRLLAASGDLRLVSTDDQRVIVEAYELSEYGTVSVDLNIPTAPFEFGAASVGPIKLPPLYVVLLTDISGGANFSGLVAPVVSAARIGPAGNIVLAVTPPAITLNGTVARAATPAADLLITTFLASVGAIVPWLLPVAVTLVGTIRVLADNVTQVNARTVGLRWAFNISWVFDSNAGRLEPVVTVAGTLGSVVVTSTWLTPNILANLVESLILGFGNIFGTWTRELANAAARGLQAALRTAGLGLPVGRQFGLKASGGSTISTTDRILILEADVAPDLVDVMTRGFQTQNLTRMQLGSELGRAVTTMRDDLNGPPVTPPALPTLAIGVFAGLGVSQNALNTYVLAQWSSGLYEATVSDPTTLTAIATQAPQMITHFGGTPFQQLGVWAATTPRVEVAPGAVTAAGRPLVVIFDDVRICLRKIPRTNMTQNAFPASPTSVGELSFSFSVPASAHVEWPWVLSLDLLNAPAAVQLETVGAWELVDPTDAFVMQKVPQPELDAVARLVAPFLLQRGVGTPGTPITDAPVWNRTAPAVQEQVLGMAADPMSGAAAQRLYMELLTIPQRGLVMVPGIETALLQLFDGSGAPLLLLLSGAPPGSTLATLTCAQGTTARNAIFNIAPNLLPFGP